jgi:hypothetical protein
MPDLALKKKYAEFYKLGARAPVLLAVPPLRFLMLEGRGDIGGTAYGSAVRTLYALAYGTKFEAKRRLSLSYPVMPLEAIYRDASGSGTARIEELGDAHWTLMLLLPDEISSEFVEDVKDKVAAKKDPPRLSEARVQTFTEGTSVQMLHIGPYATETPTVELLYDLAGDKRMEMIGPHHEIYLSDPGRTEPAKLKTLIRYAVRPRR